MRDNSGHLFHSILFLSREDFRRKGIRDYGKENNKPISIVFNHTDAHHIFMHHIFILATEIANRISRR